MFRLLIFCLIFLAGPVQAHSKKEATTPAANATVSDVPVIEMVFDDNMLITSFSLTGPQGDVATTRETDLTPAQAFRATPEENLSEGAYEVEWRGLASDGHPMQGSFGFTVSTDD